MPLVLESIIYNYWSLKPSVVPYCLKIDQKYIYEQYLLNALDIIWIEGEVLDVKKITGELSEDEKRVFREYVIGKKIKLLYLHRILSLYDYMCFSEESWSIFRDVGAFPEEYSLRVKLNKIINETKNQTIDLYPYRDIYAGSI